MLETSVSSAYEGNESNTFKQISGMSFVYDAKSKSIVSMTLADGTEMTDAGVYTVLNEDELPESAGAVMVYDGYDDLVQALLNYLDSPEYDVEKYAAAEGRILELADFTSAASPKE